MPLQWPHPPRHRPQNDDLQERRCATGPRESKMESPSQTRRTSYLQPQALRTPRRGWVRRNEGRRRATRPAMLAMLAVLAVLAALAAHPAAAGEALAAADYREYTVPIGGDVEPLRLLTDAHQASAPLVRLGSGGGSGSVVLDSAAAECNGAEASGQGCDAEHRVAQTGRVVWPSSVLLLHTLRLEVPDAHWPALRCLELGSGTGVVGLALARWGARSVLLTDLPHMVPTLQANLAANSIGGEHIAGAEQVARAAVLDWNSPEQGLAAAASTGSSFNLIVAADVIYSKGAVKPFLTALQTALGGSWPGGARAHPSRSGDVESGRSWEPVAFVALHERGKGFLARYFRVHARRAGFAIEILNSTAAGQAIEAESAAVDVSVRVAGGEIAAA
eukprot:COSAG02_NODE_10583_length_1907_cov_15.271186_2_plen_389_part_01